MPYGHSQICNGIIQGKHLGRYTCKCVNYQEYYFNRFFTDSFSCLSHSPSQRPTQAGMQARGRHQEGGGDRAGFTAAGAPQARCSSGFAEGQGKQGSYPTTADRWFCREINHLESLLGWPKPKRPKCFSSLSIKAVFDFWLPGERAAAAGSLYGQPPLAHISSSAVIFSDLLLQ